MEDKEQARFQSDGYWKANLNNLSSRNQEDGLCSSPRWRFGRNGKRPSEYLPQEHVSGAREIIFDALKTGQGDAERLIRARLIAGRQLREAVQIAVCGIGNTGLGADLGLERHFRDIQAVLVHAPQEDTSVSILGRAAFDRRNRDEAAASSYSTGAPILKTA